MADTHGSHDSKLRPNLLIALVVGLVIGFAVGKMVTTPSPGSAAGTANAQAQLPANPNEVVYKVPVDQAYARGNVEGPLVTIVEFSDYECPFCSRAHETVKKLEDEYAGKLRLVMRHNPLGFHPRAQPAALAALAAGEQGKFWEFHDRLFAGGPKALGEEQLSQYAGELGLNLGKWNEDRKSPKLQQQIARDQGLAQQLGASGTPAFFINGRLLSGAQPIDRFKQVIDEELRKAESLVKGGVRPSEVYARLTEKGLERQAAQPQRPAAPQQPRPQKTAYKKVEFPANAPSIGPKNAKVTIVEWSDFECPFCGRVNPTLQQVKEQYPNDVRLVFRHQPLPFHKSAQLAAEASMAAHEQGKFWPYHDKLFANQRALDRESLEGYARELGLDLTRFRAALDSGKFRTYVQADSQAGSAVDASGTPTFFINGRQLVGAQPFESFKAMIEEEKARAEKALATGVKPEGLYAHLIENLPKEPEIKINTEGAPAKGPANAPVQIVAFSDFECPFCSRVIPTLKQLEDEYQGKIRLSFKHQPLSFHKNAKPAANAAMAAHEQGKFWEYHDKLFANQRALDRESLEKYAQELGLDMNRFRSAMDSNKYDRKIEADSQEGMRVGASGTPTFFINGRLLSGAQPYASFKAIVDEELAKKKK